MSAAEMVLPINGRKEFCFDRRPQSVAPARRVAPASTYFVGLVEEV